MRTGSEPVTARSPLRLRLWLSVWGLFWGAGGAVIFVLAGVEVWAGLCAAIALIALADIALVVHRMRQGPHFQPGRDIPPYEPVHGTLRRYPRAQHLHRP
ncbi:DUF6343 family protein [Streptomyces montanisoli]|uniref:Uncharacterized protein n=1 Tax=Streptomyces montanisoli TaxID=2798581 RepID=A0A940MI48_9ACTN|nr:DUF6343 family protein [Streptomyces montanisoli]MBP0461644.1 hypothetical protein [Streptomyces montanisoli]